MRPLLLLFIAVGLAACGGGAEREPEAEPRASATGPGLSIEQALASELEGPLLVNGNLLIEGGDVRLCSALAESFPPQCGGPALEVQELDLENVGGLQSEGDVSWSDAPIQLLGTVEDGVLTVSQNAQA